MKLQDRVAVVTGAASGIGAATALLFARHQARVALVDLDDDGLAKVREALVAAGGEAIAISADVSSAEAAASGIARVVAEWGRLDTVVTASGISIGGTVASTDEASWDRVFAVNVKGTYLWLHAALPHLIARGGGSIVMIGSQLAVSSGGNNAAYIASKGAIASLARTMAVDHASQGIRVNAVMPAVIDTPMSRRSLRRYADPEATRGRWMERHPLKRFGTPEEVARAILFLASDDASFTTGSLLFVDGGWTAM
jgi:NAD(P)-dependent dehydrogenase (short-subunit alcohol dehydrogenase family)